ncbi:MAG: ATP-binding cassette domain-containing protein [Chloroflexi bacterium]|nr:ATP-binding cassette domain-containing protein [Chloroflexota bacterium]
MNDSCFLAAEQISYAFPNGDGRLILDRVSLEIAPGAFVVLVGPSGVGKSTLLRILGGLLPPGGGQMWTNGRPGQIHDEPGAAMPLGIVFQRDNLMPWRTVYENVALPLELQGVYGRAAHDRVGQMLDLVGLAGEAADYPAQLSGGMAQRVALARALVHKPLLLLLDEPFGALDALTRERMGQELLRIWQANPVTVFMVTHSIAEAVFLADEVLVMGRAEGEPATITHRFAIQLARPRRFEIQRTAIFQDYVTAVREAISG